jgi:hypothetical protein
MFLEGLVESASKIILALYFLLEAVVYLFMVILLFRFLPLLSEFLRKSFTLYKYPNELVQLYRGCLICYQISSEFESVSSSLFRIPFIFSLFCFI